MKKKPTLSAEAKKSVRQFFEGKVPEETFDEVNRPEHYAKKDPQPIQVIELWSLTFNLGQAIKYIARCRDKGEMVKDLRKAVFYIKREIELEEAAVEGREPCSPEEMKA